MITLFGRIKQQGDIVVIPGPPSEQRKDVDRHPLSTTRHRVLAKRASFATLKFRQ